MHRVSSPQLAQGATQHTSSAHACAVCSAAMAGIGICFDVKGPGQDGLPDSFTLETLLEMGASIVCATLAPGALPLASRRARSSFPRTDHPSRCCCSQANPYNLEPPRVRRRTASGAMHLRQGCWLTMGWWARACVPRAGPAPPTAGAGCQGPELPGAERPAGQARHQHRRGGLCAWAWQRWEAGSGRPSFAPVHTALPVRRLVPCRTA